MNKTLVTIGPESLNTADIEYFSQYTHLFRLNGSHATLDWHQTAIQKIRSVCPSAFILMDIPGVKPRTENLNEIVIEKNQSVYFGSVSSGSDLMRVPLTRQLPKYSPNLGNFSVNDGQFLFDVIEASTEYVLGKARDSFTLLPKKGINLPGSIYDEDLQYEVYRDFIEKIKDFDIDALGLSFVQTADLVNRIKKLANEFVLVSKIENSLGLQNVQEITDVSDAIMIDRGDLVAEVGFENLFNAVESISSVTKTSGRPLIMATENLETMINRELPSKSEVISLAHSLKIGVDCFMLSEETALSRNKRVIVKWLVDFLEKSKIKYFQPDNLQFKETGYIWHALEKYDNQPTLVLTKSGYALFNFFAATNADNLTLVTPNKKLHKLSMLYRSDVNAIDMDIPDTNTVDVVYDLLSGNGVELFGHSDTLVAIYVSKYTKKPRANTLSIFNREDFDE